MIVFPSRAKQRSVGMGKGTIVLFDHCIKDMSWNKMVAVDPTLE